MLPSFSRFCLGRTLPLSRMLPRWPLLIRRLSPSRQVSCGRPQGLGFPGMNLRAVRCSRRGHSMSWEQWRTPLFCSLRGGGFAVPRRKACVSPRKHVGSFRRRVLRRSGSGWSVGGASQSRAGPASQPQGPPTLPGTGFWGALVPADPQLASGARQARCDGRDMLLACAEAKVAAVALSVCGPCTRLPPDKAPPTRFCHGGHTLRSIAEWGKVLGMW